MIARSSFKNMSEYLLSYINVRELFNLTVLPSKQVGGVLSNRRYANSGLSGFSEFLGMQGAVLLGPATLRDCLSGFSHFIRNIH